MTARCSPPCPARAPWPSPSIFSRRTIASPDTGRFHMPVCTVLPCQDTSFGRPTFTETSTGISAGEFAGEALDAVDEAGQEAIRFAGGDVGDAGEQLAQHHRELVAGEVGAKGSEERRVGK